MARKTKIQTEALTQENSSESIALIAELVTTDETTADIEQKSTAGDEKIDINTETSGDFKILLEGTASKLSPKSEGHITYQLIKDLNDARFIRLVANTSGGNFCKNPIPIKSIIDVLVKQSVDRAFKSSIMKDVFIGKGANSSNNTGFLISVLRAPEVGLITANSKRKFLSNLSKDFDVQSKKLLTL